MSIGQSQPKHHLQNTVRNRSFSRACFSFVFTVFELSHDDEAAALGRRFRP
jgi:hypothetical protein